METHQGEVPPARGQADIRAMCTIDLCNEQALEIQLRPKTPSVYGEENGHESVSRKLTP